MIGKNITEKVYTNLTNVGIDVVEFTTETTKVKNRVIEVTDIDRKWDTNWFAETVAKAITGEIVFKSKKNIPVYFELKRVTAENDKALINFAFGNLK